MFYRAQWNAKFYVSTIYQLLFNKKNYLQLFIIYIEFNFILFSIKNINYFKINTFFVGKKWKEIDDDNKIKETGYFYP